MPFNILYVDDDDNDIQLAKFAAADAGLSAHLHTVNSAAQAIDYLQGHSTYADRAKFPMPKLLLVDLRMPRMNGLELLAWLRAQPQFLGLVLIVFTASAHPADITRACQLGANAFVQKPSSQSELVQFLKVINDFWGSFHEFPQPQQTGLIQDLPDPNPQLVP
jgi:CheY-like chemotaxis protein